jgi:hypothetical protein
MYAFEAVASQPKMKVGSIACSDRALCQGNR